MHDHRAIIGGSNEKIILQLFTSHGRVTWILAFFGKGRDTGQKKPINAVMTLTRSRIKGSYIPSRTIRPCRVLAMETPRTECIEGDFHETSVRVPIWKLPCSSRSTQSFPFFYLCPGWCRLAVHSSPSTARRTLTVRSAAQSC